MNHINGIKTDNRVENLEWCTVAENVQHSYRTGLNVSKKGYESHAGKLDRLQVTAIRDIYHNNHSFGVLSEMARYFNVSRKTVENAALNVIY